MNGVVNLLKPPGISSHGAVSIVRRILGVRKAGHGGTLDPGAAGVLPVFVGRATRLAAFAQEGDKAYRAEMTLGVETDTQDAAGDVVRVAADFSVPIERLEEAAASFVGEIEQTPPMASAVRVGGRRLYEYARQGVAVDRPPRRVRIYSLEILSVLPSGGGKPQAPPPRKLGPGDRVLLDVRCSKGAYIRTLCADIGAALGCGAHMSFLVRTRAGGLALEDATTIEDLEESAAQGAPALLPPDAGLEWLPVVRLSAEQCRSAIHGKRLNLEAPGEWTRLYTPDGRLLGLARSLQGWLHPRPVLLRAEELPR